MISIESKQQRVFVTTVPDQLGLVKTLKGSDCIVPVMKNPMNAHKSTITLQTGNMRRTILSSESTFRLHENMYTKSKTKTFSVIPSQNTNNMCVKLQRF